MSDRRVRLHIWIEDRQDDHVLCYLWQAQPVEHVSAFLVNELLAGRMGFDPGDSGFCVRSEVVEDAP